MAQSQSLVAVTLAAGTHWICTCGRLQNYPRCNGHHKGTPWQPLALELPATKTIEITP